MMMTATMSRDELLSYRNRATIKHKNNQPKSTTDEINLDIFTCSTPNHDEANNHLIISISNTTTNLTIPNSNTIESVNSDITDKQHLIKKNRQIDPPDKIYRIRQNNRRGEAHCPIPMNR